MSCNRESREANGLPAFPIALAKAPGSAGGPKELIVMKRGNRKRPRLEMGNELPTEVTAAGDGFITIEISCRFMGPFPSGSCRARCVPSPAGQGLFLGVLCRFREEVLPTADVLVVRGLCRQAKEDPVVRADDAFP